MLRIHQVAIVIVMISLGLSSFAANQREVANVVRTYCIECHDGATKKGDLDLEA